MISRLSAFLCSSLFLSDDPSNPNYYALLGDAYRSLGARTPVPDDTELTDSAKNEARKRLSKLTVAEYEKGLFADPHGAEHWEANRVRSEEAFHKALALDPANPAACRGLGFLYEKQGARADAIANFQRYLSLAPGAKDFRQAQIHLESLQKQDAANAEAAPK